MSHEATRSASFCTGAWDSSAVSTRATMRENIVSPPTFCVSTSRAPSSTTVPANTVAPFCFSCGTLSPVMGAWFTDASPPATVPSTGIFSPARTMTISPTCTCSRGMVWSPPARRTRAVCGTLPMSALIDARARSVFSSAMNSAMRMMTINVAPATYSRPSIAMTVAIVTNTSVPIFRSRTRSTKPIFASGYRPMATMTKSAIRGITPKRYSRIPMPTTTMRATSAQRAVVIRLDGDFPTAGASAADDIILPWHCQRCATSVARAGDG